MTIFSTYFISRETEHLLEFREKNAKKIAVASLFIPMGVIFITLLYDKNNNCPLPVEEANGNGDLFAIIFFFIIGLSFIFAALYPFIFRGYLTVNKKDKCIYFLRGLRRIIFHPHTIPFAEIDHLRIESHDGYRGGPDFDLIFLMRKHKSKILLDKSFSDFYTNELSSKICSYAECQVFHEGIGYRQHLPGMGPFK